MKSNVLERLQVLEEQLSAIESTARAVEGEFKSSNQVRGWGEWERGKGWREMEERRKWRKEERRMEEEHFVSWHTLMLHIVPAFLPCIQLLHTLDQLQTVSEAPHPLKLDEEMAAINVLEAPSPTGSTSDSEKGTQITGPSVPPSLASNISVVIVQDPPMHDGKQETTAVQRHHDIPVRDPQTGRRKVEYVTEMEQVVPKLDVSQEQKRAMDTAVSQDRVTDSQPLPLSVDTPSKAKQKVHVQFQDWPQRVQESKVNRQTVSQRYWITRLFRTNFSNYGPSLILEFLK